MTPEERAVQVAEALFAGERPGRIATSSLIATAIAEAVAAERERCAEIAKALAEELVAEGNRIMGSPSSVAFEVERQIRRGT